MAGGPRRLPSPGAGEGRRAERARDREIRPMPLVTPGCRSSRGSVLWSPGRYSSAASPGAAVDPNPPSFLLNNAPDMPRLNNTPPAAAPEFAPALRLTRRFWLLNGVAWLAICVFFYSRAWLVSYYRETPFYPVQ